MNSRATPRWVFAAASALRLFTLSTAANAEGLGALFGLPPGQVPPPMGRVHITEMLRNTTGQDANDLHVSIVSHAHANTVLPVAATASEFSTSQISEAVAGFNVDFSDGIVPAGGDVRVTWDTLPIAAEGSQIRAHHFTQDGASLGPGAAPNLSVELVDAAGGVNVLVENHGDQPALVSGEIFTADPALQATGDLGGVNTIPAFRILYDYRPWDGFLELIETGQTSNLLFLPFGYFEQPPPADPFAGSAAGAGGGPVEEGEAAAILAGQRMVGLTLFNDSNGTNLAIGFVFVPEPTMLALCLTAAATLVGNRRIRPVCHPLRRKSSQSSSNVRFGTSSDGRRT